MKIQDVIHWFGQPSFGNLLKIIAIIVPIILFSQSKNIIRLSAQFKTMPLKERDSHVLLRDMEIKNKGIDISQLALTQVFLWNSGNKIIDADRKVISDPLRVIFGKDTKIIKAEIGAETRGGNNPSVKISRTDNSASIDFDFFDIGDGIRIDILHTGKELFPSLGGIIKGMPKGIVIVSKRFRTSNKMPSDWLSLISLDYYFFFSIFCYILGWIPDHIFKRFFTNNLTINQSRVLQLTTAIVGFLFFLFWIWGLHHSPALDHYPTVLETSSKKII